MEATSGSGLHQLTHDNVKISSKIDLRWKVNLFLVFFMFSPLAWHERRSDRRGHAHTHQAKVEKHPPGPPQGGNSTCGCWQRWWHHLEANSPLVGGQGGVFNCATLLRLMRMGSCQVLILNMQGLSQAVDGLFFDLPHTFASNPELLPDFFQRVWFLVIF